MRIATIVSAVLTLSSCAPPPTTLEQIAARGELRVATLNSPTTYYLGAQGPEGLEYALASAFAEQLGVRLAMRPYANEQELMRALESGAADIVAAQITYRGDWERFAFASRPYDQVAQLVVHARGTLKPRKLGDLVGRRIVVTQGSPQATELELLREGIPLELEWTEMPPRSVDRPLDALATGDADVAIVDALGFRYIREAYPEIQSAFELAHGRSVQWIVRRGSHGLRGAIDAFLGSQAAIRLIAAATVEPPVRAEPRMPFVTARAFRMHTESRLPLLKPWFEEAARETGLDWRLLAAIGYQESKWDAEAVSPNGAMGVMMLMPKTAESVGVTDPFDARQNILGGARYFIEVREKIPARISEPDRTSLALAAYNVGFGHLEDARIITQMRGGNPDKWADVRGNLPLLAQEGWYLRVQRGYARGWEPAQFVGRVRQYLSVLEWRTLPTMETVLQLEDEEPAPPEAAPASEPSGSPAAAPDRGRR
jgi:membrane-bound lytic murein transglycosylase F